MSNASDNKPWDSLRQNLIKYPDKPIPMKKIDLIIDALLVAESSVWFDKIAEALAAARELRELKPVAYMDSKGVLFNNTTHPHLNTPLYALDGEQA